MKKFLIIPALFSLIAVSCTTTDVKIKTVPRDGYETYYNDHYVGRTPCGVEASNLIFKSHYLTLKSADNKVVYNGKMEDELKWANCCIFSWIYGVGLLWSYGPKEYQVIDINSGGRIPASGKKEAVGKTVVGSGTGQYRLAVMDFQAKGIPAGIAQNVSELVRTELINSNRYIIIERAQMDQILKEQGIQQSGCTEISCAVQAGQILSANKILIGSIMKIGKNIVISGRIVDVEKGVGEKAASESMESIDDIVKAANAFGMKISDSN